MCHHASYSAILHYVRAARRNAWSSRYVTGQQTFTLPDTFPAHGKSILPCPRWVHMLPALATKILVDTMWAEALIVLAEFGLVSYKCYVVNTSLGSSLACPQMPDTGTRPSSGLQPRVTADWLHSDPNRASDQIYEWETSVCYLSHWGLLELMMGMLLRKSWWIHTGNITWKIHKCGGKL